jgi:CRISPR-associated protein Csy3
MANENPFTPSMLAFTRSLETSEALMFGLNSDTAIFNPIEVVETGQRGQSSQQNLNQKKVGISKAGKSNPQMVEIARVPASCDTLVIQCGLRVMPNSLQPASTDSADAYRAYADLAKKYGELGGYKVLAERYLENIANGRFAWRNRSLSSTANVSISFQGKEISFNPFMLTVGEIQGLDAIKAALKTGDAADVDSLVSYIARGLYEEPADISFAWHGSVLPNAEVYPSQEYKFKAKPEDRKSDPSRMLASVRTSFNGRDIQQASMHSQKIGAALRAIDDWHQDPFYGAIPINPYGGVQEASIALRHGNKNAPSLYDLTKKPILFIETLVVNALNDNLHFFMANLIRGGVYGNSKEDS